MSVNIYIACDDCRKRLHIGQKSVGRLWFYDAEPGVMKHVWSWLDDHPNHRQRLTTEHDTAIEDYADVECAHT